MSLIAEINNDNSSLNNSRKSFSRSANFDLMIEKEAYLSNDSKQKYILDKLLSNHLLPPLINITDEFLEPLIVWGPITDHIIRGAEKIPEGTIFKMSIINNKRNGLTRGLAELKSSDNVELGVVIHDDKIYKVLNNIYYLNNERHRIDGPAVERSDGVKGWYRKGKIHRVGGPAFEKPDGTKGWQLNGKQHREKGPAFEESDGSKIWFLHNKKHREDGPAVENSNGSREWWIYGMLHRNPGEGPAMQLADGYTAWYKRGLLHRENNFAEVTIDGTRNWWVNGMLHNAEGPAVIEVNGTKEWWVSGKLHRIDGPAIESWDGDEEYYIEGRFYPNEKKYKEALWLLR